MNFMEKFNELANRTLVPIADKLANQRHLAAIRMEWLLLFHYQSWEVLA